MNSFIFICPIIANYISGISRFYYLYLLYSNKTQSKESIIFTLMNFSVSLLWIIYLSYLPDLYNLFTKTSIDLSTSFFAVLIISYNKFYLSNNSEIIERDTNLRIKES